MKIKLIAACTVAVTLMTVQAMGQAVETSVAEESGPKVSTKGGLSVTSGDFKLKFGGRIQYDYNRAEKNGEVDEDGFDLRRARLYVSGTVAEDWAFKTQFNTDGEGFEDLYLRYTGWGKGATVTVGNQNMPFGLQQLTSSNDISILERSAIAERFAVGRAEGLVFAGENSNHTYALGAFREDVSDEPGEESGFAARYTLAPIKSDAAVVHLGIAYKDIEQSSALGVEFGAAYGPLHFQAEYIDVEEADNDDLSGYYLQAGYILTGESLPYKGGKFRRVKPNNKSGAWEVVARLEEGDGDYGDIELGATDASAYALGLNYYANNNVRIGVNYTDGEDNNADNDGSEFRLRFQLTF